MLKQKYENKTNQLHTSTKSKHNPEIETFHYLKIYFKGKRLSLEQLYTWKIQNLTVFHFLMLLFVMLCV